MDDYLKHNGVCRTKLIYTKLREGIKDPVHNYPDAGIDFFVPPDFKPVLLNIGQSVHIPLGIKVHVPENYVLMAGNKGSVSLYKGLLYGGGIVDSGYTGELMIQMIKVCSGIPNEKICESIMPNEKIIQFMLIPVAMSNESDNNLLLEYTNEEYIKTFSNSRRGEGGYGSTGVV